MLHSSEVEKHLEVEDGLLEENEKIIVDFNLSKKIETTLVIKYSLTLEMKVKPIHLLFFCVLMLW
jgi:hypothetical protein